MRPDKRNLSFNFAKGVDTKTDPFQLSPGIFASIFNAVFTKMGLLQKRNGFQTLAAPPASNFLTTFQGNLVAIGLSLAAFLQGISQWVTQGPIHTVALSVLSLVRTSSSQSTIDTAVWTGQAGSLACSAWIDAAGNQFYQVQDATTGQVMITPTALPSTAHSPRVFVLGNNFLVTFIATVSASPHLQYIAIPIYSPGSPGAATDISTQVSALTAPYDGFVAGGSLFLSWDGSDGGGALRMTRISSTLAQSNTVAVTTYASTYISVTADTTGNSTVVWTTFLSGTTLYATAYSNGLAQVLAPTSVSTGLSALVGLTSVAQNQSVTALYQTSSTYSYSSARSDFVTTRACTQLGVVGASAVLARSVGLASKAFLVANSPYVLLAYGSSNSGKLQPTYFLSDLTGNIIGKLAYENGGGYYTGTVLPSVTVTGKLAQVGYLYKFMIQAANAAGLTPPSTTLNVYSQVGMNLATFNFAPQIASTVELGNGLHLTGGFLWHYDGVKPVEHGFFLFPEDITVTTSGAGGLITAQDYYYAAVYEWTDGQGLTHRGAPSIPVKITTTGATSTNTINVPTNRLTYKTGANPSRIVLYRWSTAQQTYYQVTSITSPTLNSTTADSVAITDTLADSAIIGNNILYTTGGTAENIAAPACTAAVRFKSRLVLIDAEDENLLWISKPVAEGTPVELSDLLTYYVPPIAGVEGSTGKAKSLAFMDDKLVIFERMGASYITGDGPNLAGQNSDYPLQPTPIAATVGCVNQASIVSTPEGILFDTDKGRWLLRRDLTTVYQGAPVEAYNGYAVTSAVAVPATNQIRMTLATGVTLMYDYFYGQWGFFNLPQAVSSVIYNKLHTILTAAGLVMQETPGAYLDAASPVLMSFTTGWMNLAGLQGYQRAYFLYFLGQYLSPHKLLLSIAYDYNPSPLQTTLVLPDNFGPVYGGDANWGSASKWGGPEVPEQWKIHLAKQSCQAFQLTLSEIFDPSYGTAAGAGLTLSGFNCVVGLKKPYAPIRAARQVG